MNYRQAGYAKVEKGLLRQMLYLQSEWMDFKNLSGVWKLIRIGITCIQLIYKICLSDFCFQFEFFFNFDFQMHKTYLKSFVFEILFIGVYRSRSTCYSLMAKFEVYNVFSF